MNSLYHYRAVITIAGFKFEVTISGVGITKPSGSAEKGSEICRIGCCTVKSRSLRCHSVASVLDMQRVLSGLAVTLPFAFEGAAVWSDQQTLAWFLL
ncbi:MAG: hypothetical protein PVH64_01740 [Bacillota bacterium]